MTQRVNVFWKVLSEEEMEGGKDANAGPMASLPSDGPQSSRRINKRKFSGSFFPPSGPLS